MIWKWKEKEGIAVTMGHLTVALAEIGKNDIAHKLIGMLFFYLFVCLFCFFFCRFFKMAQNSCLFSFFVSFFWGERERESFRTKCDFSGLQLYCFEW